MFKVIVGCYEQIVLGYTVLINISDKEDNIFLQYEQQFSDHSHLGCIRCIASNNFVVASGSTDESLSLFNMKSNTDLGPLQVLFLCKLPGYFDCYVPLTVIVFT